MNVNPQVVQNTAKVLYSIVKVITCNRQDVYFSLIGIIVAIVIFSADLTTKKINSIEKRMIAKKLPISITIYLSIGIILALWLEKIIVKSNIFCNGFVLAIEIALDIAIIISFVLTIRLMCKSMKLTSDDIHYSKELKEYIEKQTENIENESDNIEETYKISNKEFIKKLTKTNCLLYERGDFMFKDDYVGLLANFDGFVVNINKSGLPKQKLNTKTVGNDSTLYIENVLGRYVRKGDIICYCNKEHEEEYRDTREYFKVNEKYSPYNTRMKEIIECLFSRAISENGDFDKDNSIKEYMVFLYDKKCNKAIDLIVDEISDYFYEIRDKDTNLRHYYYFIKSIREYALKYDDFPNYTKLDDLILSCFYMFLEADDAEDRIDTIKISYSMQLYELRNKNSEFYDYTLSNFLKLFYYQIRYGKYKIIKELIEDNYTIFDRYENKNNVIQIINLSFVCGLVKGLLTKLNNTKSKVKEEEEKESIKEILDYINSEEYYYDGVELVERYRETPQLSPFTYGVSQKCEMYIEKQKSGVFFTVNEIDDVELLVKLLNLFECYIFIKQKYEKIEYKKEDKYFFEQFEKVVKENRKEDDVINNKLKYETLEDYLMYAISKCKSDEENYIKTANIKRSNFIDFEEEIRKEVYKTEDLLELLNERSKIKYDETGFESSLSLSYLLPRELFIDYDSYKNTLIDPYKNSFGSAIIDRYCTYINDNFKTYNILEELNEAIYKEDNFLIFVNEDLFFNKYVDRITKNNKIVINGKEIDCYLSSNEIVGIKAVKVDELPNIYIEEKCSSKDKEHVSNGVYVETFDLANNDRKRQEILEHNKKESNDSLLTKVLFIAMMNVKIK